MNLTQSQLNDFLSKIGLEDVKVVEDEKDSDFDENLAFESVDTSRESIILSKKGDEIATDKVKSEIGKLNGSLRSALVRATGVDRKLLKDDMKLDDMINAAVAHKMSGVDQNILDQQAQIDEVVRAWEAKVNEKDSEWTGKYNELNEKYISRDRLAAIKDFLKTNKAPISWDLDVAASEIDKALRDSYHVNYDEEKKAIAVFEKANPTKAALNATGNQNFSLLEFAKEYLTPRKGWETDTRNAPPRTDGDPYINMFNNNGAQPDKKPITQAEKTGSVMEQFIATAAE